ncbi:MAG: pyridoxal-phosphate-dependent aminotransferase family protein [bacterium]
MKKEYLFTPGPVTIPPETLGAMAMPIFHHRTPRANALMEEIAEGLEKLLSTRNRIFTITSSGTGAMEASIVNTISPGDRVLVANTGNFGERFARIARAYGADVIEVISPPGEPVNVGEVARKLSEDPSIRVVTAQLCETSTGTTNDIEKLGDVVRGSGAILIVDAISGLGADEMRADDWGVDIVVAGSQKALMIPPGLAFVSVSDRAWEFVERSTAPKFYFDLKAYRKRYPQGPWTPAISLMVGLRESLSLMNSIGYEGLLEHHRRLAEAVRSAISAMGLQVFSKRPSNAVTAVKVPEGIDGDEIPAVLEDRYGVAIAEGQGDLKGKIFRIGHLGYLGDLDVIVAVSALEATLRQLGYDVDWGKGVAAAERSLFSRSPH